MKRTLLVAIAIMCGSLCFAQNQNDSQKTFKVTIGECTHGSVTVEPSIPADGCMLPEGTVLKIKATPDQGFAFECGYQAMDGGFGYFTEYFTPDFEVTVNGNCSVGASFIEPQLLEGFRCIQDVVYAKPGVKPLKYDVYIPDGAKKLPGIVIIHGGGWAMNCEDVMSGLARELVKDGKYVVFSIDYRWIRNADGDATPNSMNQLIEDCYGAILHIQEHASEYGLDPKKLAVTGDSAGGHLCTAVANMIEMVGDGGFGVTPGVYQYLPTYMPKGMSAKKARKKLMAIKAVAPNYGVFSIEGLKRFAGVSDEESRALSPLDNIPPVSKRSIPQWINRGTEDGLISDESTVEYFNAVKAAGQRVEYVRVPGANHAFYDWKPDGNVKAIFWKYGAPYAHKMEEFFNTVFYK